MGDLKICKHVLDCNKGDCQATRVLLEAIHTLVTNVYRRVLNNRPKDCGDRAFLSIRIAEARCRSRPLQLTARMLTASSRVS
jgi:hypothetical protein